MLIKPSPKTAPALRGGLACLLIAAVAAMFVLHWVDETLDRYNLNVFAATIGKIPGALKSKLVTALTAPLHGYKPKPSFNFSLSVLGFDLKQNLQTWPVVSGNLERSPPIFRTA